MNEEIDYLIKKVNKIKTLTKSMSFDNKEVRVASYEERISDILNLDINSKEFKYFREQYL